MRNNFILLNILIIITFLPQNHVFGGDSEELSSAIGSESLHQPTGNTTDSPLSFLGFVNSFLFDENPKFIGYKVLLEFIKQDDVKRIFDGEPGLMDDVTKSARQLSKNVERLRYKNIISPVLANWNQKGWITQEPEAELSRVLKKIYYDMQLKHTSPDWNQLFAETITEMGLNSVNINHPENYDLNKSAIDRTNKKHLFREGHLRGVQANPILKKTFHVDPKNWHVLDTAIEKYRSSVLTEFTKLIGSSDFIKLTESAEGFRENIPLARAIFGMFTHSSMFTNKSLDQARFIVKVESKLFKNPYDIHHSTQLVLADCAFGRRDLYSTIRKAVDSKNASLIFENMEEFKIDQFVLRDITDGDIYGPDNLLTMIQAAIDFHDQKHWELRDEKALTHGATALNMELLYDIFNADTGFDTIRELESKNTSSYENPLNLDNLEHNINASYDSSGNSAPKTVLKAYNMGGIDFLAIHLGTDLVPVNYSEEIDPNDPHIITAKISPTSGSDGKFYIKVPSYLEGDIKAFRLKRLSRQPHFKNFLSSNFEQKHQLMRDKKTGAYAVQVEGMGLFFETFEMEVSYIHTRKKAPILPAISKAKKKTLLSNLRTKSQAVRLADEIEESIENPNWSLLDLEMLNKENTRWSMRNSLDHRLGRKITGSPYSWEDFQQMMNSDGYFEGMCGHSAYFLNHQIRSLRLGNIESLVISGISIENMEIHDSKQFHSKVLLITESGEAVCLDSTGKKIDTQSARKQLFTVNEETAKELNFVLFKDQAKLSDVINFLNLDPAQNLRILKSVRELRVARRLYYKRLAQHHINLTTLPSKHPMRTIILYSQLVDEFFSKSSPEELLDSSNLNKLKELNIIPDQYENVLDLQKTILHALAQIKSTTSPTQNLGKPNKLYYANDVILDLAAKSESLLMQYPLETSHSACQNIFNDLKKVLY